MPVNLDRILEASNGEKIVLPAGHADYFLKKHQEETESSMKWVNAGPNVQFLHAAGRCRTGSDSVGFRSHIVYNGKSLCGFKPKTYWSGNYHTYSNCPRCIKKYNKRNPAN